jgi:hypothetical protein
MVLSMEDQRNFVKLCWLVVAMIVIMAIILMSLILLIFGVS